MTSRFHIGQCWKNERAVIKILKILEEYHIIHYVDIVTKEENWFLDGSVFACNLKLLNRLELALYSPPPKRRKKKKK